ncbi:MAG: hypothetical protein JNG89_06800, partial [Planctomycetaceae bacterium]|nr:hypothetical protein [Planctomycetaceae bacterium]
MNRALWWKAWRELRTASLACLAWMLLCAAYVLFYEWQHPLRAPIARVYTSSMLFQWFAATCLAILVSQRERWEKSLRFTRALPVSLAQTAVARISIAAAALVLPVLVAAAIVAVPIACGWIQQAGERAVYRDQPALIGGWGMLNRPSMSSAEALEFLARVMAVSLASGLQLLLVLSILGNFVRSEKTVGFLGVVLSLASLIISGQARTNGVESVLFAGLFPSSIVLPASYSGPEGSYDDLNVMRQVWPALAVNVIVLSGLFWLFKTTYGRRDAAPSAKRRWKLGLPMRWLRGVIPQFHSPLGSLVWLTLRQSVPLVVSGLMVAILIALTEVNPLGNPADVTAMNLARDLAGTTWFIGIAWSVMVAAGVFGGELQPKLARFWSSRPISPGQWLLVKYLTGLAAVLLVIDGSAMVSGFFANSLGPAVQYPSHSQMSWSYVAIIPLDHAFVYTLSVAMVIATRSGVLGAGAALGAFTIMQTVIQF